MIGPRRKETTSKGWLTSHSMSHYLEHQQEKVGRLSHGLGIQIFSRTMSKRMRIFGGSSVWLLVEGSQESNKTLKWELRFEGNHHLHRTPVETAGFAHTTLKEWGMNPQKIHESNQTGGAGPWLSGLKVPHECEDPRRSGTPLGKCGVVA